MANQDTRQAIVVQQNVIKTDQIVESISLFDSTGTPISLASALNGASLTTSTANATAGKTIASPEPAINSVVPITFADGNTVSNATVSFNGGPAKPIFLGGVPSTGAKLTVSAGGVVSFWYDGTRLNQFGVVN